MNKTVFSLLFFLILCSCIGKHSSEAPKAVINDQSNFEHEAHLGDTLQVDKAKSKLYWKGTKMRGAGKHEGEIELMNGYFITDNKT